ncbi:hypothetical protein BDL97_08G030200 [Sphagnum fallax]|nr:hypothetical protein BDL97_08G030200 [Sphagnum fallax]
MMDELLALVREKQKEKERQKERDKEREVEKEKEKEKEEDMEAALYVNCLLLGLDPSILASGGGGVISNGSRLRAGLFRHPNPRVGEALLHFLLCALRGPYLSSKDFAGVWPIFDAAQSRDFRKIVQGLINELEAQGALPRSNSRVSSLATCCGQRFVELLWQLSALALREVHQRVFPADVAANPLPAPLAEIMLENSHATALLGVTKARIALERRKFLQGAAMAVQRQGIWSSLAHDMTAEYRSLCSEEAYLDQELEKLHQELEEDGKFRERSKGNLARARADMAPVRVKSIPVDRASQLWESLLAHTEQNAKHASGPIQDLISHQEHRYRIDGAALRAAMMDCDSKSLHADMSLDDANHKLIQGEEEGGLKHSHSSERTTEGLLTIEETHSTSDNNTTAKDIAHLDVAQVLQSWTSALQQIHKQIVSLARANDGSSAPQLLKNLMEGEENSYIHALHGTLAENRQRLVNIEVLMEHLKETMAGMKEVISSLQKQVYSPDVISDSNAAESRLCGPFSPSQASISTRGEQITPCSHSSSLVTKRSSQGAGNANPKTGGQAPLRTNYEGRRTTLRSGGIQ